MVEVTISGAGAVKSVSTFYDVLDGHACQFSDVASKELAAIEAIVLTVGGLANNAEVDGMVSEPLLPDCKSAPGEVAERLSMFGVPLVRHITYTAAHRSPYPDTGGFTRVSLTATVRLTAKKDGWLIALLRDIDSDHKAALAPAGSMMTDHIAREGIDPTHRVAALGASEPCTDRQTCGRSVRPKPCSCRPARYHSFAEPNGAGGAADDLRASGGAGGLPVCVGAGGGSACCGPAVTFADCPERPGLLLRDLSSEDWREYEYNGCTYRVYDPVALYYRDGGTTHRVVDATGVVHCHPTPSVDSGCALRWKSKQGAPPVAF